ncbi:MAG: YihA family ribosome biogenesis GTP-binding protein [Marinilabiliaceae bacterium]|nr:YihA family ribosome biogenesis GTP-binding protein [Marinilabiliaceae bacterium]
MEIKEARFIVSNSKVNKCPPPKLPEYAFIGRSNVGKSSLINMLCNNKKLAKISSTPGKTQLINHFLINQSWYLVDLPGYGYAKVSKTLRSGFSKIITSYLEQRTNLLCLFILIDSRLPPIEQDLEFIRKIGSLGIPLSIIFTKFDKLNKTESNIKIEHYKHTLLNDWEELPPIFITSATKKTGKDEILKYIDSINKTW